jgi:hypothetical protein
MQENIQTKRKMVGESIAGQRRVDIYRSAVGQKRRLWMGGEKQQPSILPGPQILQSDNRPFWQVRWSNWDMLQLFSSRFLSKGPRFKVLLELRAAFDAEGRACLTRLPAFATRAFSLS